MTMKKINWSDVGFWIVVIIFVIIIGYLFISGGAFE
jgi:hypothetical protein